MAQKFKANTNSEKEYSFNSIVNRHAAFHMIYKRVKIDLFFGSRDPLIKAFTVFFVQPPPPCSITKAAAALDKNASKHLSFYYCATTFPHIHYVMDI